MEREGQLVTLELVESMRSKGPVKSAWFLLRTWRWIFNIRSQGIPLRDIFSIEKEPKNDERENLTSLTLQGDDIS